MQIYLNGEETEITERLTVADLVAERGLDPQTIVVECNLVVVPREEWPQLALSSGDKLEIVTFMGGG